jgi:hypothetical protein
MEDLMRATSSLLSALVVATCVAACDRSGPAAPSAAQPAPAAAGESTALAASPWGPETPPFNLEATLRPVGDSGFGLVKFRQPNDDSQVVNLDVWVRDLAPNSSYSLQRAVDLTVDGDCTSSGWLTLGNGLQPQAIVTDAAGTGRASLWRDLGAFAPGSRFDIHFQVVPLGTATPVLASDCYQFVISR